MAAFAHKPGYCFRRGRVRIASTLYAGALFAWRAYPLSKSTCWQAASFPEFLSTLTTGSLPTTGGSSRKTCGSTHRTIGKSARALQHERVTVVAHQTGHIHTLYPKATISPEVFEAFRGKIHSFLTTDITFEILANFLRQKQQVQKCFQITHSCCGKPRYIEAEKVYFFSKDFFVLLLLALILIIIGRMLTSSVEDKESTVAQTVFYLCDWWDTLYRIYSLAVYSYF